MNWKLIILLSIFGLGMAFATLSLIPFQIEPIFWLVIFLICAYIIAKQCKTRFFLHGFLVSLLNSVWITTSYIYFFGVYFINHLDLMEIMANLPFQTRPKILMAIAGPLFGAFSGLILGLFAFVAAKILNKNNKFAN